MAELFPIHAAANHPQMGCMRQNEGCSTQVKAIVAAGLVFVILGITFSAIPSISSIASRAFIGVGTPLLSLSLIAGIWQSNSLNPNTKWKVALVASLVLFGGGIALASALSGPVSVAGTVMITVGTSALLSSIIGWAMHCYKKQENSSHQVAQSNSGAAMIFNDGSASTHPTNLGPQWVPQSSRPKSEGGAFTGRGHQTGRNEEFSKFCEHQNQLGHPELATWDNFKLSETPEFKNWCNEQGAENTSIAAYKEYLAEQEVQDIEARAQREAQLKEGFETRNFEENKQHYIGTRNILLLQDIHSIRTLGKSLTQMSAIKNEKKFQGTIKDTNQNFFGWKRDDTLFVVIQHTNGHKCVAYYIWPENPTRCNATYIKLEENKLT